ncbi:MAG: DUF6885 family protein [Chloroflexota bacterium]
MRPIEAGVDLPGLPGGTHVQFFPAFGPIDDEYRRLRDQKEETCGVYGLSYLLRGTGWRRHGTEEVNENYLAYLGRVNLSVAEAKRNEEISRLVAEGRLDVVEAERDYGHEWYRYGLPFTSLEREMGTSVEGVKLACETATDGQVVAIPVPSRRGDEVFFDEARFAGLMAAILSGIQDWEAQLMLNYRADRLLDPNHERYSVGNVVAYSHEPSFFERDSWAVGHFVTVAGVVEFASDTRWLIIRDTYKSKGFRGYHLQPMSLIREALVREDGREGGVLLIVPKAKAEAVTTAVRELGLPMGVWNNGSPCRR